jgi:hypothetical protein
MQYIVVKDFSDIQDDRHVYHAGDTFPRMGLEVSAERVAELASDNNKRGEILIKAVKVAQEPEIQPVSDETEVFDEIIDKEKRPPKKSNKKGK